MLSLDINFRQKTNNNNADDIAEILRVVQHQRYLFPFEDISLEHHVESYKTKKQENLLNESEVAALVKNICAYMTDTVSEAAKKVIFLVARPLRLTPSPSS